MLHLSSLEFFTLVVLAVGWRFPDWLLKLIGLAEAVKRFRARWPPTARRRRPWWKWWW
jgi:hypothetical protein